MPIEEKFGIRTAVWDKIIAVLQNNPAVKAIILFGSRAKGNFKPGSDIDLCIKGEEIQDKDLSSLLLQLDELNLPWMLDLLHYESLSNPEIKDHIERVGIELVQSSYK
jgi:predicted nucleotidyltransferase